MNDISKDSQTGSQKKPQHTHDKSFCFYHKSSYDWEQERRKSAYFYDDGTLSFLWRAHTLTVLVLFIGILFFEAFLCSCDSTENDVHFNTKRGILAVILAFLLFGVTQTPDGPFRRPHPALWRLTFCLSIVYELLLIFLLFQNVSEGRNLLGYIDPSLGVPLPEREYGANCSFYDSSHETNPLHNVWDNMDCFVPMHFIGWWLKTLIIRDYWLCTVLSVMFEMAEYSLEHQLPNFKECWWDHWILDVLVCNGLGIYLGMKSLNYLAIKPYHWRGLWAIPSYRGKLRRIIQQFGPYSWIDFEWNPTGSLKRWFFVLSITGFFLVAEINNFYLRMILWVPPDHTFFVSRGVMFLFWGAVALRETYQYLEDPKCKEFGRQSWLLIAIVLTELFVIGKFGWPIVSKPFPQHIIILWSIIFFLLLSYTIWKFYLSPRLHPSAEVFHSNGLLRAARQSSLRNRNMKKHKNGKIKKLSNGLSNNLTKKYHHHHHHNNNNTIKNDIIDGKDAGIVGNDVGENRYLVRNDGNLIFRESREKVEIE